MRSVLLIRKYFNLNVKFCQSEVRWQERALGLNSTNTTIVYNLGADHNISSGTS